MADSRLVPHNEGAKDTIIFTVCPRYDPGQAIVCEYNVNPQYTVQSRDYVALYAVEEFQPSKTVFNYMTWQWADIRGTADHRAINFPARHLPQASSTFLLFVYISRSNGVIGSSDSFQIIHSCGDPLSIVSYTTDKSSFVVLEKSPSDFSTSTTSLIRNSQTTFPSSHQSAIIYTSQNKNDDDTSSTQELQETNEVEIEEVSTAYQAESVSEHSQTSKGNSCTVIQPEVTETENSDKISTVAGPAARPNLKYKTEVVPESNGSTTEMQGETHVDLLASRVPDQNGVNAKEDIDRLQSQLIREIEKSLEMKRTVERTTKEKEALLKRINHLEGEMGKRAVENAMSQHIPEKQRDVTTLHDQIAKLTQEKQYLSNEVESVQSQLEAREHDLSHVKAKVRAANTRIRDLEHALITERLTYENNLKRLLTDDSSVTTSSNEAPTNNDLGHTAEEEYHSALQGECDESSDHEGLASFIPTQQRSASALVRLGIEDEATATPERQGLVQGQSTDIRCPICNKPALSFRDQAAFHVHVNEHFLD